MMNKTNTRLDRQAPTATHDRALKRCTTRRRRKRQTTLPDLVEVFDFRKNWDVVKPFLQHPKAVATLERGINEYFAMRRRECLEEGLSTEGWDITYDPAHGPWSYVSSDHWALRAEELFEQAVARGEFIFREGEDKDAEMERAFAFQQQHYPQPDTVEWYQLFGACHWLAPWLKELGNLVFPELSWKVLAGPRHSLACGTDADGNIRILFDILNFDRMTAKELIEFASRRSGKRSLTRKPRYTRLTEIWKS